MSITAAAFLAVYFGLVALALFRHPVFGLYSYLWVFYSNPSSKWWGSDIPDWRWSLIAAGVSLLATLIATQVRTASKSAQASPSWFANWGARLLVLYVVWMWVQSLWAISPAYHLEGCVLFTKYAVLYFILYSIIRDQPSLEHFVWGHVAGCFVWGWIAFGSDVHGRLEMNLGPGVDDSNIVGFHMVTGLAFAGLMFIGLRGLKRWAAFAALPLVLNTVILTASRSAVLGMLAAGAAVVWFAPRRQRLWVMTATALGLVLLLILARNEVFWERTSTITLNENEMDPSAASRLVLARTGWAMAQDFPLGAGHRGFDVLSPKYVPQEFLNVEGVRAAHATFIAVLVDQGFPGLVLFLALHIWAIARLIKVKRTARARDDVVLGMYCAAIAGSLAAYFVAGLFINLLQAEIGVWLVALLAILDSLQAAATATAKEPNRPVAYVPAMLQPAFGKEA